ncbi:two-component system, sensor histidine kinase YesM [Evansella caseinilytica]|uniref:Two-component system, sensor histidine kinase YesM n=1 Tax=Evansella caseinilytica TaxID=1503961 RepID=A0A1H3IVG0_9BACI|nr:sensor histidine kinase [Evansella caseinilytica]SDY31662.1 two-component system, sensor histidine kinase YesM [Evansella caseinilytica]
MKLFEINNLPIRYKLIIHFLLVSLLPSIGLGVLIAWAVDRIIEQQVNDNTLQLIEKVNRSLEYHVDNVQNMTYFISFNPQMEEFFAGNIDVENLGANEEYEIMKFLQHFSTLYPEVAGIIVVNSAGDYISNELYPRTARKLTNESWYREAVENQGIFKALGHPPEQRSIASHVNYKEDEVVSVVRAIIDPDTQEEKGVVLIDLKLRVIAEIIKDVRLGKTGYLMVIDDSGEKVYSPAAPMIDDVPPEVIAEIVNESNYGTFARTINGEKIQFIYRKSPFTNWTTVGVFSTKQAIPEVKQIRFYVISFVFFVCLIGITASYYLSYSMLKPINELMVAMQKAELGDLSSRYNGTRTDEVGRLGRSFNKMLSQIHKLMKLTEKQQRQKREAELHSLQAHIKPHFLYNTLDTIQWMARKKGAMDVAALVDSLSRLFRIGLSKGDMIIPLKDEIEHVQSYLKIQSTRYQDKLNYAITIDPQVENVSVLKIVLQPIVENAIYHGIKERRGPGLIEITAEEHDYNLVITVRDNGKGMAEEQLRELREQLTVFFSNEENRHRNKIIGYGVVNVHARLKLTFGEEYGVNIESELNQGTTVTIIHPILKRR